MNPNTKESIKEFGNIEREFRSYTPTTFIQPSKDWKEGNPEFLMNPENREFLEKNFTKAVIFQRKRELYLEELTLLHKIIENAIAFKDSTFKFPKERVYVLYFDISRGNFDLLEEENWKKYFSKKIAESILQKYNLFDISDIHIRLEKSKMDLVLNVYTILTNPNSHPHE